MKQVILDRNDVKIAIRYMMQTIGVAVKKGEGERYAVPCVVMSAKEYNNVYGAMCSIWKEVCGR